MRQLPVPALVAINAATAGDQASAAIPTQNIFSMSAQVVASGAPVGVAKVQVSNDEAVSIPNQFAPTNWSDLSGVTVSVSAAGVFLIPKFDVCYNYVRLVYTKTSGTGAITVNVKGLGA